MSAATLHEKIGKQGLSRRAGWLTLASAQTVEALGRHTTRYGLVIVLLWIGGMKFTAYEAEGISGFVSNSPLMFWAYQLFSTGQFSAILGVTEVLTATLIAVRPFSARLSALGSALAVGMFLTTLSFLFSTPGVVELSLGFPALSAMPGQFLIKDAVLLGAALWTAGEALRAIQQEGT
jgi:uncharacterized membrane protein YkgB